MLKFASGCQNAERSNRNVHGLIHLAGLTVPAMETCNLSNGM